MPLSPPPKVVLDTNVLYPFLLRDTLLRLAGAGFFQVYWSKEILDELTRSLVESAGAAPEKAQRLRRTMEHYFPEAMVSGYRRLIGSMENDSKDRHVAAAAVKAQAHVIVTDNLKDFAKLPPGLRAQSADEFLLEMLHLDPDAIVGELRAQAAALQRPPVTFEELLGGLEHLVPRFIQAVRAH